MSENTDEPEIPAGGATCAHASLALTIIDLSKPGDLALVHRAVVNGWPISQHVREQVCAQLPAAVAAFGPGDRRSDRRFKRLAALMVGMGLGNPIDSSVPPSPRRPKRNPNRRKFRALGRQRAREALHQRATALSGT